MITDEYSGQSSSVNQPDPKPGPFLAKVVSNMDPTYNGILEVEILRPVGASNSEGQLHQVRYMSPFYGVTDFKYTGKTPLDYNGAQKSYGFWAVPPDVGTTVIIIFIDGDPKRGFWIGCVPDINMNFMTPGIAATHKVTEDVSSDAAGNAGRVPTAEYSKSDEQSETEIYPNRNLKPFHPSAFALLAQGLLFDDARGITTSSARRESPSMVFGMSTPGPIDKRDGAKKGFVGKKEHEVNTFVSRLGGSTFVMDDGDAAFLRRTAPTDGPPDYASVEDGESDGDVTRPHNELIRLRTRTGHQIVMNNSEDFIYITNARGTAWIELTSDGKIDIYAQDSISVRTQNDFNFYADRDINLEAGRNINMKASAAGTGDNTVNGRIQIEAIGDFIRIVGGDEKTQVAGNQDNTVIGAVAQSFESTWDVTVGNAVNITTGADLNLNVSGASVVSSSGDFTISAANTAIDGGNINLNSGIAKPAGTATTATAPDPLSTIDNPAPDNNSVPAAPGNAITSIMARVPTTEPYPHHENLDATLFKPDATDRETAAPIDIPSFWNTYANARDTFTPPPPTKGQ